MAAAIRWVAHPVTVVAALVLLVNDHVAKGLWPGPVTGTLSDIAGLVVAPALLGLVCGVITPRFPPRVMAAGAVVLTGLGFTLVKLTGTGAAVASAAWSVLAGPSYILADPTDLVALPALGAAWWAWWDAGRTAPVSDATSARVRVLLALPLALLAVAGTSAPIQPAAVTVVGERDGQVIVAGTFDPLVATGSGLDRWRRLTPEEVDAYGAVVAPQGSRQYRACVPGASGHCYRVRGAHLDSYRGGVPNGGRVLGVDQTTDGGRTWRTAWEISSGRWLFLARRHELYRNRDDHLLASVDILVREVKGGHQVIVANGADGLVVRDAAGSWRRIAVRGPAVSPDPSSASPDPSSPGAPSASPGTASSAASPRWYAHPGPISVVPAPLTGFGAGLMSETAGVIVVMLLGWLVASWVTAWRIRRVRTASAVLWPLVTVVAVICAIPGFGALALFDFLPLTVLAAGFVACVALATAASQADLPRSRALPMAGATVAAGLAFVAPYLGWTLGVPDRYVTATAVAWSLGGAGLVATALVAWWAGQRPLPTSDGVDPDLATYSAGSGAPSKSTIE